jgi:hypothetical protein
LILASHHRDRRSKHLISNLFPLFFSSLLGRKRLRAETDGWNRLVAAIASALAAQAEEI